MAGPGRKSIQFVGSVRVAPPTCCAGHRPPKLYARRRRAPVPASRLWTPLSTDASPRHRREEASMTPGTAPWPGPCDGAPASFPTNATSGVASPILPCSLLLARNGVSSVLCRRQHCQLSR